MKTPNRVLFTEAVSLSANVDHVLTNENLNGLDHRDLYDLAEKLERASHLLLVLGDRKFQESIDMDVPAFNEVPF